MAIRKNFNWSETINKIKAMEGTSPSYNKDDENLYKPKLDAEGNGGAIIRFLPPHPEEDMPFVKKMTHFFQGVGGYFVAECPKAIGLDCPVCKHNYKMWGIDKDLARQRKAKTSYYANILVVKDPASPENEGKVFKFKYGVKMQEKIMEKLSPEKGSIDEPVLVFDYEKGANFKLKVKTQRMFLNGREVSVPNYDSSSFMEPSPIALNGKPLTDAELEELDKKLYRLNEIVDKSKFKSFEEISEMFFKKTGERIPLTSDDPEWYAGSKKVNDTDIKSIKEAPADFSKLSDDDYSFGSKNDEDSNVHTTTTEDEDDDDEFFRKLREQN